MLLESGRPHSSEIEKQLQRMLASDRFRLAEKQSAFLALVVKRALEGKKSSGDVIARKLFPDKVCKTPDGKLQIIGHDVRQTANNLRRTLRKYRAEEGRNDPIIISLPEPPKDRTVKLAEGEAYTPQFAFNPSHSVARELRLGNHFHRRGLIEDEETAMRHFAKALAICPNHVDAAIGVIESWCGLIGWHQELDEEIRYVLLPKATQIVDAEWLRGSTYWRVHAAAGNLYFHARGGGVKPDFEKAAEYFEKAKTLDRIETESYQPYILFVISAGNADDALALAKRYLDAHEDESRAYTTYVMALARSKKYEDIESVLERALTIDNAAMWVRYLMAQLRIWQKRQNEALPHIELMKLLLDHKSFGKMAQELETRIALPDHLRSDRLLAEPSSE